MSRGESVWESAFGAAYVSYLASHGFCGTGPIETVNSAATYADMLADMAKRAAEERDAKRITDVAKAIAHNNPMPMAEAIGLAHISMSSAIEREAAEAQTRLTAARVAAIDGLKE